MHSDAIPRQIELLHTHHLDLWSELEAALRVLRVVQEEIAALRTAQLKKGEPPSVALCSAQILRRHVHTLSGRANTLTSTIAELDQTVAELIEDLNAAAADHPLTGAAANASSR